MPARKRHATKYPGVYYVKGVSVHGRVEKIYYIRYRKNGKAIDEPVGRQYQDDMTPAKAAGIRSRRVENDDLPNTVRRSIANKKKWTLDALWEEYLSMKTLKGRKSDVSRYEKYLRKPLGSVIPSEISQREIDLYRISLLKDKSPQTVKHIFTLLRRIVRFGVLKGHCLPPSFTIEMPSVDNEKTEDLTPQQLSALIEAIGQDSHPYAGIMMKFVLYTGMRRGELFRLKWADIDFERGFISIRSPKAGKDQRIPLNDSARALLASVVRTDSEYVFPGRDGQERQSIRAQVNRIKERAGLPKDFRPLHGLRHVFASMLASSGQVDMYTLQRLLTHADPKMTQRYAHLRDEALKRASDIAGSIIDNIQE